MFIYFYWPTNGNYSVQAFNKKEAAIDFAYTHMSNQLGKYPKKTPKLKKSININIANLDNAMHLPVLADPIANMYVPPAPPAPQVVREDAIGRAIQQARVMLGIPNNDAPVAEEQIAAAIEGGDVFVQVAGRMHQFEQPIQYLDADIPLPAPIPVQPRLPRLGIDYYDAAPAPVPAQPRLRLGEDTKPPKKQSIDPQSKELEELLFTLETLKNTPTIDNAKKSMFLFDEYSKYVLSNESFIHDLIETNIVE